MIILNKRNNFLKCYELLRLIRFDKLIGFFLLLWPILWTLWLSNRQPPDIGVLILFVISVFITRSFGCIINDYIDRDIDCFIARTKFRPLSCGLVTVIEALVLFFILVFISCCIMIILSFKLQTILLSLLTFLLICLYPYTKRCIFFPQLFLGLVFGCSVLIVFSVFGISLCSILPWLLFLINMVWVIIYDTEYAIVDREDDICLGLQSSAIFLGNYDKIFIGTLQIVMLFLLVIIGVIVDLSIFFYCSLFGVGMLFIWQQMLLYNRNENKCFRAFLSNNYVGCLIFCGIFMDILVF